jgi:hypothetical protein
MYPKDWSHSHFVDVKFSQYVALQVRHPWFIEVQFAHPIPHNLQVEFDDTMYPAV